MQSGFMASSVRTVSSSDSPFFRLEDSACRFMVSAPSREAAVAKLMRVRVEGFEEGQRHGLAAQRGQFFQRMALKFLEGLGFIEQEKRSAPRSAPRCSAGRASVLPLRFLGDMSRPARRMRDAGAAAASSFHALDEHDALFLVDFLQPDLDDLAVAGLHGPPHEAGFDRAVRDGRGRSARTGARGWGRPRSKRPFMAARAVRPV